MIYSPFDIVIVPFPFTDLGKIKRRPAVVLSSQDNFNEVVAHTVLAMITSARNEPWALDVSIQDLKRAGLLKPSVIRMKVFTIDNRLIFDKIGDLGTKDRRVIRQNIETLFEDLV